MSSLIDRLRVLLPDYWIMNYKYSKEWDKALNRLLDNNSFTEITLYTARIGEIDVWVKNHPYASFTPMGSRSLPVVRPSRLTILRARRKLMKEGYAKILYGDFEYLGRSK